MVDPFTVGKRAAARAAADLVGSGSRVGLGTGSTVAHLLERLAERRRDEGLDLVGVPTSHATEARARELGLPLTTLDDLEGRLDVVIDGADEVDPRMDLIKGGGGALTREKIVAYAADSMVVVVSANKIVDRLGSTFRLPIEILRFGSRQTRAAIAAVCGGEAPVRRSDRGDPFSTDSGGWIVDAPIPPERAENRAELEAFATELSAIPGLVEHGLFLDRARRVLVGHEDGSITG